MAFCVLSAPPALAEWLVGGTVLSGSAATTPQWLVDTPPLFLVPTLGLSIVCGGHFLDFVDGLVVGPNKISAQHVNFLGCNTTTPPKTCALEEVEETISTGGILGRAFLATGEEDRLLFAPETKGTFADIRFNEANTCAFNSVEPMKGSFTLGMPTGRLNLSTQSLAGLGSVENNSLEVGGDRLYIDNVKMLLRLSSNAVISFG
jgi:hypothetical protein